MDAQRFDRLVKTLSSRRSVLGCAAGLAAILKVPGPAAAACNNDCGPCKRCTKGKCKPKPGSPPCGPCSVCRGGKCVAKCPPEDCVDGGDGEICLKDCDPACDGCSRCDPIRGRCEPLCDARFCVDGCCRVPCDQPCGECSVCEFGTCVPLCDGGQCVDGRCEIPCNPECATDEECVGGACFPKCDPACGPDQGCVKTSSGNTCFDLQGNCPGSDGACFTADSIQCQVDGKAGKCVTLPGGEPFCARRVACATCGSDLDCQSQGFGPNSRCVTDCEFCCPSGGSGCVSFRGEED